MKAYSDKLADEYTLAFGNAKNLFGDSVDSYAVKFDNNGGSGSMENATVNQGEKLTLPTCTFTAPDGQQFKAWDVNGTEYQPNTQVDITDDTTVKAVWINVSDTTDTSENPNGCFVDML